MLDYETTQFSNFTIACASVLAILKTVSAAEFAEEWLQSVALKIVDQKEGLDPQ